MSEGETNRNPWQWTAKKEAAALGFASGKEWDVIAKEVGASVSTLSAWRKAPEFQARMQEHLDEIVSEGRRILQRNATKAAQQVVNVLEYGNVQHATRLKAAQDVLDRVGVSAKSRIEHTGADGGPIEAKVTHDFSDLQLIQLAEAAAAAARARDAAQAGADAGDELAGGLPE